MAEDKYEFVIVNNVGKVKITKPDNTVIITNASEIASTDMKAIVDSKIKEVFKKQN